MISDKDATQLVRGLVFAVQKSRSDMRESMGDGEVADELLADLHPWLFGTTSILPKMIEWQAICEKSGQIRGMDLLNFTALIEMKDPIILALLPAYDYPVVERDYRWAAQTWKWIA